MFFLMVNVPSSTSCRRIDIWALCLNRIRLLLLRFPSVLVLLPQLLALVSKRLLLNRSLPRQLRLQPFHSLVLSKLFFACGSWHTPTGRQIARIRVVVVRMVRKIMGLFQLGRVFCPTSCTCWCP